jgi:hypothetical protein
VHRLLSAAVAAAVVVTGFAGATAAQAASPSPTGAARAAAEARADASAALGGIALPEPGPRFHAAAAAKVQSVHQTVAVRVAAKRYDVRAESTGPAAHPTRITLHLGPVEQQVQVRRLVRITVTRHGAHTPLLATTTTYRRYVVLQADLVANPLAASRTHFPTRTAFLAALTHGLALHSTELTREYGAVLRLAQMALDISATLLGAVAEIAADPAADLSAVPTVQTTTGSGGYTGTVVLTGTAAALTVTATNTTDASVLTETVAGEAVTLTYTAHGSTVTRTV